METVGSWATEKGKGVGACQTAASTPHHLLPQNHSQFPADFLESSSKSLRQSPEPVPHDCAAGYIC